MECDKKSLEDKCLTWILFIFIAAFIVCGAFYFCVSTQRDLAVERHQITIAVDSIKGEVYSKAEVDSLVEVIRQHEDNLSNKYQKYLQDEDKENRTQTFIVYFVGVILSIFGFFGYKSFKDIQKHGREISKEVSEKEAKEQIDKQLPDLIRQEMTRTYSREAINTLEQKVKNSTTPELQSYIDDSVKTKVEEYINSQLLVSPESSGKGNAAEADETKQEEQLFT